MKSSILDQRHLRANSNSVDIDFLKFIENVVLKRRFIQSLLLLHERNCFWIS